MKIRFGLVLTLALARPRRLRRRRVLGRLAAEHPSAGPGGTTLQQGERPRQDEDTRAAQKRARRRPRSTEDEAQAEPFYQQALTSAQRRHRGGLTNPLASGWPAWPAIGVGEYEQADRFLDQAEELRPIYQLETEGIREQAWIDLYNKAAPLVSTGQYEEARQGLRERQRHLRRASRGHASRSGQIYAQLREHDKALENLDRAQALINSERMRAGGLRHGRELAGAGGGDPADEGVRPRRRRPVRGGGGDLPPDRSQQDPDDVEMARNLAAMLVQMGNTQEAFQVYDDLLQPPRTCPAPTSTTSAWASTRARTTSARPRPSGRPRGREPEGPGRHRDVDALARRSTRRTPTSRPRRSGGSSSIRTTRTPT